MKKRQKARQIVLAVLLEEQSVSDHHDKTIRGNHQICAALENLSGVTWKVKVMVTAGLFGRY